MENANKGLNFLWWLLLTSSKLNLKLLHKICSLFEDKRDLQFSSNSDNFVFIFK